MSFPKSPDYKNLTRRQKVLLLLVKYRLASGRRKLHDHPLPDQVVWISGGYHAIYDFLYLIDGGGSAGYQRLWELTDKHRVPITVKRHKDGTWIYRLEMEPEDVKNYPWEPALERPFRGVWTPDGWVGNLFTFGDLVRVKGESPGSAYYSGTILYKTTSGKYAIQFPIGVRVIEAGELRKLNN